MIVDLAVYPTGNTDEICITLTKQANAYLLQIIPDRNTWDGRDTTVIATSSLIDLIINKKLRDSEYHNIIKALVSTMQQFEIIERIQKRAKDSEIHS